MQKTKLDPRALKEVYEVLLLLNLEELNKIPKPLIDAIKNNCDMEYEVDFEKLENEMLPDTENILSTIYIDYLSTDEEKNIIKKLIILEKQKKEQVKEKSFFMNIENKKELTETGNDIKINEKIQDEKSQKELQEESLKEIKAKERIQSLTVIKQENFINRIMQKIKKWMESGLWKK